jgi:hypothetical protein
MTMKKNKKKLTVSRSSKWKAEFFDMCIDAVKNSNTKNRLHNNDWVTALKKLVPYQKLIKENNIQDKPENN